MSRQEGPSYGTRRLQFIAAVWLAEDAIFVMTQALYAMMSKLPENQYFLLSSFLEAWETGIRFLSLILLGVAAGQLTRVSMSNGVERMQGNVAAVLLATGAVAVGVRWGASSFLFRLVDFRTVILPLEHALGVAITLLVHVGWVFLALSVARCSKELEVRSLAVLEPLVLLLIVFDTATGLWATISHPGGTARLVYDVQTCGVDVAFSFYLWVLARRWNERTEPAMRGALSSGS